MAASATHLPKADGPLRYCGECNEPGASILCPQCRDVAWCTVECQRRNWLAHKGTCKERVLSEEERRGWTAPPVPVAPAPVAAIEGCAWHKLLAQMSIWQDEEYRFELEGMSAHAVRVAVDEDSPEWCMAAEPQGARQRVQGRVSVVVPTTHERHGFHAQLWLCYQSQTHTDKELIVVDSGEVPSPFFTQTCRPGVRHLHIPEQLSIGEKRNLAIREYATGEVIANFDDDDLYFPAYLQTMVKLMKTSQAALVHLSAWTTVDVETGLCAVVGPSEAESCGFTMIYTYAAWRCLPWPALSFHEDRLFLQGFAEVGLPVSSRSDAGRAPTVLHLQHGSNMRASVAKNACADARAIAKQVERFEQACRRIIKLPQADYDKMGGSLLHPRLFSVALTAERPPAAKGVFLALEDTDACADDSQYDVWRRSCKGVHRKRKELLEAQSKRRFELAQTGPSCVPAVPKADADAG